MTALSTRGLRGPPVTQSASGSTTPARIAARATAPSRTTRPQRSNRSKANTSRRGARSPELRVRSVRAGSPARSPSRVRSVWSGRSVMACSPSLAYRFTITMTNDMAIVSRCQPPRALRVSAHAAALAAVCALTARPCRVSAVGQDGRMTDQHRPDPDQDDAEREGVPVTVTSDGERVVVVTPDGMGVSAHEDRPADDGRERPHEPRRPRRAAGQGHADRLDGQAAARRGAQRSARREGPGPPRRDPLSARSASSRTAWLPSWSRSSSGSPCPFSDESPSDAELRIAQAQLVGWLEGLFHGIQTALVAQQMAAQAQLQQMRQLPPGMGHGGMPSQGAPGMPRPARPAGRAGARRGHRPVPLTTAFPPGAGRFTSAPHRFRCRREPTGAERTGPVTAQPGRWSALQ